MKKLLMAIATSLVLALPAYADDAHHPDRQAGATATKPPLAEQETSIKQMQGNVKKMQSQLHRIGKAKTAEERQKLLAEHMQTMHENMILGKAMAGGDTDCPMMKGGMGMTDKKGMGMMGHGGEGHDHEAMMGQMHEGMMSRMQQLEKRMDTMQTMLDQVAKPQSALTPAK
jgi:hypothetical protein